MRIQHNITAMNAYRNYNSNTSAIAKNLEKLSSGYKINRAGDDAAGLAVSQKMRLQIAGLSQAQKNAKSGISYVQTAEGALSEVHDMLERMYTLAEQSANGTYDNDTDRVQLQKEVQSLKDEINRIGKTANFNGQGIFTSYVGTGAGATNITPTPGVQGAAGGVTGTAEEINVGGTTGTPAVVGTDLAAALKGAADGSEVKVQYNEGADNWTITAGDKSVTASGTVSGGVLSLKSDDGSKTYLTITSDDSGSDEEAFKNAFKTATATGITYTAPASKMGTGTVANLQVNGAAADSIDWVGADAEAKAEAQEALKGALEQAAADAGKSLGSGDITFKYDTTNSTYQLAVGSVSVDVSGNLDAATGALTLSLADGTEVMTITKTGESTETNFQAVTTAAKTGLAYESAIGKIDGTATGISVNSNDVTPALGDTAALEALLDGTDTGNIEVAYDSTNTKWTINGKDVTGTFSSNSMTFTDASGNTLLTLTGTNGESEQNYKDSLGTAGDTGFDFTPAAASTGGTAEDMVIVDGAAVKAVKGSGLKAALDAAATAADAEGLEDEDIKLAYDSGTSSWTISTDTLTLTGLTGTVENGVLTLTDNEGVEMMKVSDTTNTTLQDTDYQTAFGTAKTTGLTYSSAGTATAGSVTGTVAPGDKLAGNKMVIGGTTVYFKKDATDTGAPAGATALEPEDYADVDSLAAALGGVTSDNFDITAVANEAGDAVTLTLTEKAAVAGTNSASQLRQAISGGSGGGGDVNFWIGAEYFDSEGDAQSNKLTVGAMDLSVDRIGLVDAVNGVDVSESIADVDISNADDAMRFLNTIKSASNAVSDMRGSLGAIQNRLDHTINNLSVMQENMQDAESVIRDTDIAEEMMAYTKNSILVQSAQAMLAQANQLPQGVLQLLG